MVSAHRLCFAAAALGVVIAVACKPSLDDTTSIVSGPRVLAVRVDPAEAKPGDPVTFTALAVDGNGPLGSPPVDWAFCDLRKPLAELEPVSPACMTRAADYLVPIGGGGSVNGAMPDDACRQVGPEVPAPVDGGAAGRPVDPDPTGGYYQPVRIDLTAPGGDELTLAAARIACGLPGVTPEQLAEYNKSYHPNANPQPTVALADASPLPAAVAPGTRLTLRASWPDCAGAAAGCSGSEPYLTLDLATRQLVSAREAMRVSWFATAGAFDGDRSGRDATDATPFSDNGWTAPSAPATVHLWVVLRDDRGGVGWQSLSVDVR